MSKHLEKFHVIHLWMGQHDALCVVRPTQCVMPNKMGCVAVACGMVVWVDLVPLV